MLRKLRVAMGDQNRRYRLEGTVGQVTPPGLVDGWLPWVHVVISSFKGCLLGIYHGISGRNVQGYLDEFCCRLNRRSWESQIPNRLLMLCAARPPVLLQPVGC
jgi:hypothetical protein